MEKLGHFKVNAGKKRGNKGGRHLSIAAFQGGRVEIFQKGQMSLTSSKKKPIYMCVYVLLFLCHATSNNATLCRLFLWDVVDKLPDMVWSVWG